MIERPSFFAVTGGPGAGKTALIHKLAAMGEACVEESARLVLQAEARGARPRPDPGRLGELMLQRDLAAFHSAGGRTFFDRSLVDAWATARMGGAPSPEADEAVRTLRYNRRVFIASPWREIYVTDAERIQTWAEAVASFEACGAAYADAGYQLVELPLTDVARRAAFVLEVVGRA
jgi:predicted ATPase